MWVWGSTLNKGTGLHHGHTDEGHRHTSRETMLGASADELTAGAACMLPACAG